MTLNKKQKVTVSVGLVLLFVVCAYLAFRPFIKVGLKPSGYKSGAATNPATSPFEILDQDKMTIIITNPSPTP